MREHVVALVERYLPGSIRPGAGGNALTKCPFHKGGEERRPSFSINLELGLFHCFTCHVSGNIRYLLRLLGLSRDQIEYEVAPIAKQLENNRLEVELQRKHFFTNVDPFRARLALPEVLLGMYEWCPTSLVEQGFVKELLQDYEVGFDRVNQRVTYPLRDMYGTLAGISGGRTLPTQEPKYKIYQGGYYDENRRQKIAGDFGEMFDEEFPGFRCENHHFLWNYHRVYPRALEAVSGQDDRVFVVEGFKACLWMIQNGYYNTVALMGSYISDTQQRLLHRLGGRVVLFLDNDEAGRKGTLKVGNLLWRPLHGRVSVVRYPTEDVEASINDENNSQPDDYEAQGIHQMVNDSLDFHVYLTQR